MKRVLSIVLALAIILTIPFTAAATDATAEVTLTYRGIKIVVDGTTMNPVDTEGNSTEPFIIDGTTYLPVRAVAGALGLNVGWDNATSTVTLTSGGDTNYGSGTPAATNEKKTATIRYRDIKIVIDGEQITPKDSDGVVVEPFIYEGTTYLPIRAVAGALDLEVGWDGSTSTVSLDSAQPEEPEDTTGSTTGVAEPGWKIVHTKCENFYEDIDMDLSSETTYTYDANGRLLEERTTDAQGGETLFVYKYDANGTLIYESFDSSTNFMDGTPEHYVYTYDSQGRLLTGKTESYYTGMTFDEYTYDAAGNILTYHTGNDLYQYYYQYTYDAKGNMIVEDLDNGRIVYNYEYNDVGQVVHYYVAPLTELSHQCFYTYDAKGNLISERFGDDYYGYSTFTYTYDEHNNVLTQTSDGVLALSYEYKYDAAGNIIYYKEQNGKNYFEETYDSNGNLLEKYEYEYDGSTTRDVYIYDAQGRQVRNEYTSCTYYGYVEGNTPLITLYVTTDTTYDADGNVLQEKVVVSGEGTDVTSTTIVDYTYDANGNAVQQKITTDDGVSVFTNEYKYFG